MFECYYWAVQNHCKVGTFFISHPVHVVKLLSRSPSRDRIMLCRGRLSVYPVPESITLSRKWKPKIEIKFAQNVTTCLSLRQEHSSADGVSMLQHQLSGTRFHHISAHHPTVVDSLDWELDSHRLTELFSENCCWRVYSFTFYIYIYMSRVTRGSNIMSRVQGHKII